MWAVKNRSKSRLYTRTRHFSGFMLSTSAKLRQSYGYPGLKSTEVPHTCSVIQPLSSHVYWSRCGQSKIAQNHDYTHGLDISVVLFSQLPPNSGKHTDIPDSSPHRYPTHILSHNHCHHMFIREDMGRQKPLKITFIHTDSTCHWFDALNFRQTPAIIEISRTQVHTGTTHILSHNHCHHMCICQDVVSQKSSLYTRLEISGD